MGQQRQRKRVRSKIDELPSEVRLAVDGMLADVRYTYREISDYLAQQGYDISYGAVFRYAQRMNNATQRIIEAQEQTKAIIEAVKRNPDMDYTEGALQMISGGLTQKIAAAQEEFEEMPLDKAVSALISLSKTKSYKDKIYNELSGKVKTALDEFKNQVFAEIAEQDPALAKRINLFAEEFADKLENEQ